MAKITIVEPPTQITGDKGQEEQKAYFVQDMTNYGSVFWSMM